MKGKGSQCHSELCDKQLQGVGQHAWGEGRAGNQQKQAHNAFPGDLPGL